MPSEPASALIHRGNDLVVVLRWVKDDAAIDAFIAALLKARQP
ncbi:MAG: hypothetical protein ACK4F7_09955 [Inhella sp.]